VQQLVVGRPEQEHLFATRLSSSEAREFRAYIERYGTNVPRALRGAVLFMLAREQEHRKFMEGIVIPDGRAGRRIKRRKKGS
jgi:hypothetical protein